MKPYYSPLRTALIGISGYGGTHLRALQKLRLGGEIELAAATVINQEEVREKCEALEQLGCKIYGDYREMLGAERGKIDLCCIPTGIAWHCEMTLAALEVGCHVLVEKPAAATVQEVDAMIRARDRAGLMVAVGFQYLYHEDYAALKQRLLSGEIGRLREIRVKACWPRSAGYYARNDWAGRLKAGGRWVLDSPANNAFAHFLMGALHLAGEQSHEAANALHLEAELYRAQAIETFDTICARITTDTAVEILFSVTHSAPLREDPVMDLVGDKGTIRWEVGQAVTLWMPGKPASRQGLMPAAGTQDGLFAQVVSQIRGEKPEACPLEEARKHTALINAIHETIPIHSVDASHRETCPGEIGEQHIVTGINESIHRSFESGLLFSELGVNWAVPSTSGRVDPRQEFLQPVPHRVESPLTALATTAPRSLSDDLV